MKSPCLALEGIRSPVIYRETTARRRYGQGVTWALCPGSPSSHREAPLGVRSPCGNHSPMPWIAYGMGAPLDRGNLLSSSHWQMPPAGAANLLTSKRFDQLYPSVKGLSSDKVLVSGPVTVRAPCWGLDNQRSHPFPHRPVPNSADKQRDTNNIRHTRL